MTAVGTRRILWSGGEDDFCAAKIGTILAIEDKCGAGIAEVYGRLVGGTWRVNDVREVIRLALIGGGMDAKDAQKAIDLHVHGHPGGLAPSVVLAQTILEAVLIGVPEDEVGKSPAAEAMDPASTTMMDASAAQ